MTDEHLEFYADRYVRHGIKDCGVTLIQYLADPTRYAPLESLLPRQRIAAGKAMAEMLARRVTLSGSTATAACPECEARGEAAST